MAFFMDPGAMFLGCLGPSEQKFLVTLIETAAKSGYTRFVEPCAGTFAMANLAVQNGFKPEQIETSDVNMMSTVLGYAITGQSLEPLEIHAQGFSDEELLDPATALYAQLYLRTSKNAGNDYFYQILTDLRLRREEHIEIDDVDDMIESFVGKEIMEEPLEQYDKMLSPAVQFDFKNVTFTFLPHQVNDMDILVKDLESKAPEIVGVASYEQCKAFVETLSKYQKFTDIRNVGAAIHSMIENANEKMDAVGFNAEEEWTYLAKVFGSNAIPADAAEVIKQAIKKAEKEGTITSKNRWQLIEYLCADYLGK